jgi:hypothetical protein
MPHHLPGPSGSGATFVTVANDNLLRPLIRYSRSAGEGRRRAIVREAGAGVLDHDGTEHSQQSSSTIAVTPALEADLMAAVRAALSE